MINVVDIDVERAHETLFEQNSAVRPAELIRDEVLSARYDADIWLASEVDQVTGAYKFRGAFNWFSNNVNSDVHEVVAFSAGNHAAAVAACARLFGVKARIFMPEQTPQFKVDLVQRYGGNSTQVELVGETVDDSALVGELYMQQAGPSSVFIHPFDDPDVVSGQGTLGRQILDELPELNTLVVPVGGGGLASGLINATKDSSVEYVLSEPRGAASLAYGLSNPNASLATIDTFVDGAAVKKVGGIVLSTIGDVQDRVKVVAPSNEELCRQVTRMWSSSHLPNGELAGGLAAASLETVKTQLVGKTIVYIVSGGNLSNERFEQEVKV